jgi:hypothetical protein
MIRAFGVIAGLGFNMILLAAIKTDIISADLTLPG